MEPLPPPTPQLTSTAVLLASLNEHLQQLNPDFLGALGDVLASFVRAGLDQLPRPGQGETWQRWQALGAVAAHDLSLAKIFEGHTDALAIMAELHFFPEADGIWGAWCAETSNARLSISSIGGGAKFAVTGKKSWCSGASSVTHALVSSWNEENEPCLVAVKLDQPGVRITQQGWSAVGMASTASVDVVFEQAEVHLVGSPHAYVARPGFWHGGAGIASCWYGAASAIGQITRRHVQARGSQADPHQLAHLGGMEVVLAATKAVLRETAQWIDEHPCLDARRQALRARLSAEACAVEVMQRAGRALGAGPLCKDPRLARLMADLPIFLRQSHAERDLAALGQEVVQLEEEPWSL